MAEGKHRADSPRRFNPALIIIPLAVLAVGVGAYLLFGSGDEEAAPTDPVATTTSAETPPFDFTVDEAIAVASTDTPVSKLRGQAKRAAGDVAESMSGLYAAAFLDPANWQSGSYDAVLGYFEPEAAAAAKQDLKALTAGEGAGARYTSITPAESRLDVKVLFDERDRPAGYSADLVFTANAVAANGSVTKLFSSGTYILRPTSKGWKVTSYEVQRDDHERKTNNTGDASPARSASAGATP